MKLPIQETQKIASRAAMIAQNMAPKKTGRGALGISPSYAAGVVGLSIAKEVDYMLYQNYGTETRDMTELAGKVIPIRNVNGSISFKTASPSKIGTPVVSRDENGDVVSKIAWRHPGIKGKHFMERAIVQATQEWVQSASNQDIMRMLLESNVGDIVRFIQNGNS